jgi:hypothetical protein
VVKWIRLRETLSGGRADGRPWPVAGDIIDVADWEYDHCINAGWAEHADPPAPPEPVKAPEPEPVRVHANAHEPEPEEKYKPEPLAEVSRETVPEPEPAPEPAEPPRPSDPKQDWIDYAEYRGLDREKAAAMSKADLMSRYGGRL